MKKPWPRIALVIILFLGLGFWQLDQIPGEWFGDISILHEEVQAILSHPLTWRYALSAGPVYHHWVALWANFLGTTYLTYKIVSVITGAIGLVGIYLFGKAWLGDRAGWWAMAWAAGSFWLLVWSRLGSSPQILTVAVVAYSGWLLARHINTGHYKDWLLGTGLACLGWWTFPSLFAWPLATGLGIRRLWQTHQLWLLLFPVIAGTAFWLTLQSSAGSSLVSYATDKLTSHQNLGRISTTALTKLTSLLTSWLWVGDSTFRINVPHRPHIDPLAGVLMLIGLGVWACTTSLKPQLRWWGLGILLLVLPLFSPGISTDQVINSGRTFATLPFIMLAVGLGSSWLERKIGSWLVYLLVGLSTLSTIITYFGPYQQNLPNFNSPYGRLIAEYIDSQDQTTTVKLTGCCWGNWGQPEPKAIYYTLKNQHNRANIVTDFPFVSSCAELELHRKYLLIFDPAATTAIKTFQSCLTGEWTNYTDQFDQPVFVGVVGELKSP